MGSRTSREEILTLIQETKKGGATSSSVQSLDSYYDDLSSEVGGWMICCFISLTICLRYRNVPILTVLLFKAYIPPEYAKPLSLGPRVEHSMHWTHNECISYYRYQQVGIKEARGPIANGNVHVILRRVGPNQLVTQPSNAKQPNMSPNASWWNMVHVGHVCIWVVFSSFTLGTLT